MANNRILKEANNLTRLISELSKLPGLGERSAERLSFHILKLSDKDRQNLANSVLSLNNVKLCIRCFNFVDNNLNDLCDICNDGTRDNSIICVVEQIEDLWRIEKTAIYKGLYHVLHGVICPLDGKGPEDIKVRQLILRIKENKPKEIILSTNPTTEGDNTALYIQKELRPFQIRITRLGRGIPAGSNIEYLNKAILSDALKERKEQLY
jgi:recombination protein RecR